MRRLSVDGSSDESEYVGSDIDDNIRSDTDLTDVDIYTDEDEDDKQCEGIEDEV